MELSFSSRVDYLKHAWNVFRGRDHPDYLRNNIGPGYSHRPDRVRLTKGNERSIITAIFNRIALDVAAIDINHCKLDKDGRYEETLNSGLNDCLTLEANLDQTGRAFIQDPVMSMFDEGCVALVPIETTLDPEITGAYDINSMRTGKVIKWHPAHVEVSVYNEKTGQRENVYISKRATAIVENPFYAVMNEPSSTLQRLTRKLNLLDVIDEQSGSGKLDLIVQLPYTVKSPARKAQANERRKDIEDQLAGSKFGIAYVDATEKITQLNRPIENNLMKQIEYLMNMLYSQLGITQDILDGSANEQTMINYNSRTIEPILAALADEMKRKFLTKTARTKGQSIEYFRDPFKLVPVSQMAELADKLTRNEVCSSNEIRQGIGMKPSKDPKADELRNSNLNHPDEKYEMANKQTPTPEMMEEIQNGE